MLLILWLRTSLFSPNIHILQEGLWPLIISSSLIGVFLLYWIIVYQEVCPFQARYTFFFAAVMLQLFLVCNKIYNFHFKPNEIDFFFPFILVYACKNKLVLFWTWSRWFALLSSQWCCIIVFLGAKFFLMMRNVTVIGVL